MVPARLYELLPAIYVVLGVLGLIASHNALGYVCSCALLHAAWHISSLRRMYRTDPMLRAGSQPRGSWR